MSAMVAPGRMNRTGWLAAVSALAVVLLVLGCDTENQSPTGTGDPTPTCVESGEMVCECADTTDELHFKMLYPNGGETIPVGTNLTIRFCSEFEDVEMIETAITSLSIDSGRSWIKIEPTTGEPNTRLWTVPEELFVEADDGSGNLERVRLRGAQCLVRIAAYDPYSETGHLDADQSDSCFVIQ